MSETHLAEHNMDSAYDGDMQDSMVSSSSLRSTILSSSVSTSPESQVRHIYKKARYFFVNRQFPDAYSLILPLVTGSTLTKEIDSSTRDRIWQLYLTILDSIMNIPQDKLKDGFSKSEITKFKELVCEGAIWDQLTAAYHSSENLNPDMILSLLFLCARHMTHPNLVRQRLVAYLEQNKSSSSSPAFSRILDFYVLVILPACEEWDFAHSFVDTCEHFSTEKRSELSQALIRLQAKSAERRLADKEVERLKEMKKQRREKSKKKEDNPGTAASGSLSIPSDKEPSEAEKGGAPVSSKRLASQMVNLWSFILRASKKPEVIMILLEMILGLTAFLLAFAVPENRARLMRMLAQLWIKLRNTVSMGVRISYL